MNARFPVGEIDLAALLGSRICHDLVSPIGAIGNGVELMTLSAQTGDAAPADMAAELDLVRQSVETAQARLRFFRLAYGQAGADQEVGRAEVLGILTALYEGGRLKVHWAADSSLSRPEVRLAFLMLQCLESAMPYGGQVRLACDRAGWLARGEAEKLRIEPHLWEGLATGTVPADLRPSQAHFALVADAARRAGSSLSVETAGTTVTLSA